MYPACCGSRLSLFFFFSATGTTETYTLPYTTLFRSPARPHAGSPLLRLRAGRQAAGDRLARRHGTAVRPRRNPRSEEHTSELQSLRQLVCRPLLEKKKTARTAPCGPTAPTASINRW